MFSPVENLPAYRDPGEVVISTLVQRDLAFILHLLLQDRVTEGKRERIRISWTPTAVSGGKIKIVRQGFYMQGVGCLEGAGSQKWLGIMLLFTDKIVLIDCVGHGCVFGGGAGRDGCQPLDLGKAHLDLRLPGKLCVHGGWLREELRSWHVCAAPRWMRHPGRRGGESKSRQRAWVFQGKAMGPHVSSKEFPFLYFSSEHWWQCSALAIQKVDRIFPGVPCFEPFSPSRNSFLKTPCLWTETKTIPREREREKPESKQPLIQNNECWWI